MENLREAAKGENLKWTIMYKEPTKAAREERFNKIEDFFAEIGEAEEQHEKRYLALLAWVESNEFFKRDILSKWQCRNCRYIHIGKEAPEVYPACRHTKAFFEPYC